MIEMQYECTLVPQVPNFCIASHKLLSILSISGNSFQLQYFIFTLNDKKNHLDSLGLQGDEMATFFASLA